MPPKQKHGVVAKHATKAPPGRPAAAKTAPAAVKRRQQQQQQPNPTTATAKAAAPKRQAKVTTKAMNRARPTTAPVAPRFDPEKDPFGRLLVECGMLEECNEIPPQQTNAEGVPPSSDPLPISSLARHRRSGLALTLESAIKTADLLVQARRRQFSVAAAQREGVQQTFHELLFYRRPHTPFASRPQLNTVFTHRQPSNNTHPLRLEGAPAAAGFRYISRSLLLREQREKMLKLLLRTRPEDSM